MKKSNFQYECAIKLQHVLSEGFTRYIKRWSFLVPQPYFDPRVMDKIIFNNLTLMIVWIIIEFEGTSEMDVVNKFIYFKVNGMIIFQGCKFNFTTQLM
jgi:hypothetical protein